MRLRHAPLLSLLLLSACASDRAAREPDETGAEPMLTAAQLPHAVVREAFVTALTPKENVDSPASWVAPDGRVLLLATAKKTSRLMVYDGDSGTELRRYGSPGAKPGQFLRPNGIAVHGDYAFVVERDNRRVQVLRLPDLTPVGMFGNAELKQPYGLWVREMGQRQVEVLVSDAYMAGEDANGDEIPPPLAELNQRYQRYAITLEGASLQARSLGAFGDTSEAGAIRVPESLWGDVAHDRLLIAEEDLKTGTALREYDLQGRYRGRTLGLGLFRAQAEGIALWTCADGSGYWLATDQFKDRSLFHVFDRNTLAHLGAFAGGTVGNTDGVWLQQGATKRFPRGVFYAVHDDMGVAAFDWRDIAKALSLRESCES
ncbi:phytase [Lysobacter silvisoli]|uniref:Phytase n=1 Tax=Lysobacter silvisoli TaxID=2293254 RepID=A0A371JY23_9GAMM|nr:phytase [Lysobacter silvisoli]RDZ26497.1 phytase [Lysobacter silvisoli]